MADFRPGTRNFKMSLKYLVPESKEVIKDYWWCAKMIQEPTRKAFLLTKDG